MMWDPVWAGAYRTHCGKGEGYVSTTTHCKPHDAWGKRPSHLTLLSNLECHNKYLYLANSLLKTFEGYKLAFTMLKTNAHKQIFHFANGLLRTFEG